VYSKDPNEDQKKDLKMKTLNDYSTQTRALMAGGQLAITVESFLSPRQTHGVKSPPRLTGDMIENMREALSVYNKAFRVWNHKGDIVETFYKIKYFNDSTKQWVDHPHCVPTHNKREIFRTLKSFRRGNLKMVGREKATTFKVFCVRVWSKKSR
jgi:hypothetical protein